MPKTMLFNLDIKFSSKETKLEVSCGFTKPEQTLFPMDSWKGVTSTHEKKILCIDRKKNPEQPDHFIWQTRVLGLLANIPKLKSKLHFMIFTFEKLDQPYFFRTYDFHKIRINLSKCNCWGKLTILLAVMSYENILAN